MALSSIHESASHGNSNGTEPTSGDTIERNVNVEKQFRPNPDAKPFIPNPLSVAAAKWHYFSNENGKNVNGVVSPYYIDRDNVVVAGSTSTHGNPMKKHIAFHLVSNVLDDEVPEESGKDQMNNGLLNNPHSNVYGGGNMTTSDHVDSWQTSPSNFTLPLSADRTSDKRSINNKSIYEIWSPDPSPNELNNLSPSDEAMNTYQGQQQQLLDSPNATNSMIETSELSFEQVHNDMNPSNFTPGHTQNASNFTPGHTQNASNFTPGHMQNYDEMVDENNEAMNPNVNFCYQNDINVNGMHSPMYNQYNYRNIDRGAEVGLRAEVGDEYQAMFLNKNEMMMGNDTSSMMVDQNDYYAFAQYFDRYQPVGDNRYRVGNKFGQAAQAVQMSYDMKMSFMEELGISLDECRDQLKHLERDYRKADTSLTQEFRLRRSSGSDSGSLKYPPNSTRVDKLVIDQQREHQKVESLIGRIERLGFTPMHPNVGVALDLWLSAIKDLRNVRKNELANISENVHSHSGKSNMQGDICNLIACVKELTKHTRSSRTIVWCALQMLYASLPNGSSSGD